MCLFVECLEWVGKGREVNEIVFIWSELKILRRKSSNATAVAVSNVVGVNFNKTATFDTFCFLDNTCLVVD